MLLFHSPSPGMLGLFLTLVGFVLAITTLEDFDIEEGPCFQSVDFGLTTQDSSCFFEFCGRNECYREVCNAGANTCDSTHVANPSPGSCHRTLTNNPFPDDVEDVPDNAILDCSKVDPITSPEPLSPVFDAAIQFLGVTPPMNVVNLAAPGVNSSVPS